MTKLKEKEQMACATLKIVHNKAQKQSKGCFVQPDPYLKRCFDWHMEALDTLVTGLELYLNSGTEESKRQALKSAKNFRNVIARYGQIPEYREEFNRLNLCSNE